MPFRADDGRPLDEILLAQRPADGYVFDLRAGLIYDDPVTGRQYRVPPNAASDDTEHGTDLASVPMFLWSFIASYGRQSAPAILHDARSVDAKRLGDRRRAYAQRLEDDRVFRTALREQGVPLLRAWMMWAWVSADRERQFGGASGWLLLAQSIVGGLVMVAAFVLAVFVSPLWLLAMLVPILAALAWGRTAVLVLWVTGSVALSVPLVIAQLAPLAVFRIIEVVVELVSGGDPAGVVRPTVSAERERGR